MNSVKDNYRKIQATVDAPTRLIAVSKTKPVELLQEAYDAGARLFGENKALEMRDKHEVLPKDIEWHFIGHLQSNKVKYIAPFVSLIHSIDSISLLQTVEKEAAKNNRIIDCLLQFHIATEETKFGLNMEEAIELLESDAYKSLCHVSIVGVMGMATNTDDCDVIRREFATLRSYRDELKTRFFADKPQFKEISMGMSNDYQIAMEEGCTLVRVGSSIFGARQYGISVNDEK